MSTTEESNDWYKDLTQEKLEQYLLEIANAREKAEHTSETRRETIANAVEFVFKNMESERKNKFKLIAGCKTFGTIDMSLGNVCMDPTCEPCSTFHKLLKKEVEAWGNKTIDEHLKKNNDESTN